MEIELFYGAIAGDIIGSPYEFGVGGKTKNFPLFSSNSHYTDDTILTLAIAEALMSLNNKFDLEEIKIRCKLSMLKWGRLYPNAGYGSSFNKWLNSIDPQPYGSYGNGSAMRVSAVGWLYNTIKDVRNVARATAEITHNHPEGIKGAEAVASAIFLARKGKTKEEIKKYISKEFNYDLSRTCNEIRTNYHHTETCQETVPEAIICFLEGVNFEDSIRNAISLGGDADTLACITGSICEPYINFNIPTNIIIKVKEMVNMEMRDIINEMGSRILKENNIL